MVLAPRFRHQVEVLDFLRRLCRTIMQELRRRRWDRTGTASCRKRSSGHRGSSEPSLLIDAGHETCHGLNFSIAAMLIAFDSARACTCMAPASPAEAFEKASAAFTGKVTKIYQSFWDAAGITRTAITGSSSKSRSDGRGPEQEALWSSPDSPGKRVGFRSKRRRSIWSTWPQARPISRQVFARGQRVLLALNRKWSNLIGW